MDNDGYTFVVDMLLGNAVHAVLGEGINAIVVWTRKDGRLNKGEPFSRNTFTSTDPNDCERPSH